MDKKIDLLLQQAINSFQESNINQADDLINLILKIQPKNFEALLIKGVILGANNMHKQALDFLHKALKINPKNFYVNFNLAKALSETNNDLLAIQYHTAAIRLSPNNPEALLNFGKSLFQLNRFAEALTQFEQSTLLKPDFAEAWLNKGVSLYKLNRLREALTSYDRAIQLKPDLAEAWSAKGVTLHNLKHFEEALTQFNRAIQLKPDLAEIWSNKGMTLRSLNLFDESLTCFDRALELNPNLAEAWSGKGVTLQDLNRPDEALNHFNEAIRLKPNFPESWCGMGITLHDLNRFKDALTHFDRALQLKPDFAEVWLNKGISFRSLNLFEESITCFDRALELNPNLAEAWSGKGVTLHDLNRPEEALTNFDQAIQLKPDFAEAWSNRGLTLTYLGQIELANQAYTNSIKSDPNYLIAHNNLLLNLNYYETLSLDLIQKKAQEFGQIVSKNSVPKFSNWNLISPVEKLRVGFISGDFRVHSVGRFLEGLITNLDQTEFELYAFPTIDRTDILTKRIKPFFKEWFPIYGMSDFNAAKFVHQKGIHILIDLAGHTNHNRLAVFSYKPAPIQISWLGFPITTGLPEIDYILGDPHSLPSHFQNQFSEIIVQLPQIYLSFQPPKAFLNFGNSPSIQNGFITFGSFNNLSKINSKVIFTWANILNSLPHSKLLLKTRQLSNPLVKAEIYAKFATHGIDESRLILKGTIESEIEHMEEYNKVDIALDTFPYPGVTTSAEALWMGVPVISLKGNSFLSSTPNSLLKNLEICNLIASDTGDYVKKAIKLASNLDKLNQLRKTIRQNSLKSPLFNNVEFAKNFGITLHRIWEKHFKILQS